MIVIRSYLKGFWERFDRHSAEVVRSYAVGSSACFDFGLKRAVVSLFVDERSDFAASLRYGEPFWASDPNDDIDGFRVWHGGTLAVGVSGCGFGHVALGHVEARHVQFPAEGRFAFACDAG